MRFTVTWLPEAEEELLQIWLDAKDRNVVSSAANKVDRELAEEPESKGVDFHGGRLFVSGPIVVGVLVRELDRIVEVRRVWRIS